MSRVEVPTQIIENGYMEYQWSEDIQEQLIQLNYQCTRCNFAKCMELADRLEGWLKKINSKRDNISYGKYQELMITSYKMIGHTRDIISGKGECMLSYIQIIVWYKFYPDLAKYALQCFVKLDNVHPYGSWKDIKYFCNACVQYGLDDNHPLIQYALELITNELIFENKENPKTLVGKWIPRENSKKFGWLFSKLAKLYFPHYLKSALTEENKISALQKSKTEYRKLISSLNKKLNTVQINQCQGRWAKIDQKNLTSLTIHKQKRAFLNVTSRGLQRSSVNDRLECAHEFIKKVFEKDDCGKRMSMNNFGKEACRLLKHGTKSEKDLLNSQWIDKMKKIKQLAPMIAILDLNPSMMDRDRGEPFYSAIGIACCIAEKSVLGKRILTIHSTTTWHNLEHCETFIDMVQYIMEIEQTNNANLHTALSIILDADKKIIAEDVCNIALVILSDMQLQNDFSSKTMFDTIKHYYENTGIKITGIPYSSPHIIFWNLRSTSEFPVMSNNKNISMISGSEITPLKKFYFKETKGKNCSNAWMSWIESMNKPRYAYLESKIKKNLDFYE